MRGTTVPINKAMIRPVMMAGVEKQLALLNALLCFPLIAATHFQLPWCFLGLMFYVLMHVVFQLISKNDPHLGRLFKRSTRYSIKAYFPAKSHPSMMAIWKITTISRP